MNQPWIYTCSLSWTPLPPPSPSHPSGSSQCTRPEHLTHASNLDWRCVSRLILHMFQCSSFILDVVSSFSLSPFLVSLTKVLSILFIFSKNQLYQNELWKSTGYTFSNVHETLYRMHHMLGHSTSLNNIKKNGIIESTFSDHNSMELVIKWRKKTRNYMKTKN